MRRIAGAAAIGGLMLAGAAALAQTPVDQPAERTLRHAGSVRSYLIHVPPASRRRDAASPVLIVLHGGGGRAVTATMPAETGARCRPARPVPMLVINGTSDPMVPYEGGHVRLFGRNRGAIWSTGRTVEFWASVNGCRSAPRSAALADRDPSDGTVTIRHEYQSCRAPVTLLEVQGGGHTWPGASQYLPTALIGAVSRDFDASEEIAAFFKSVWRQP